MQFYNILLVFSNKCIFTEGENIFVRLNSTTLIELLNFQMVVGSYTPCFSYLKDLVVYSFKIVRPKTEFYGHTLLPSYGSSTPVMERILISIHLLSVSSGCWFRSGGRWWRVKRKLQCTESHLFFSQGVSCLLSITLISIKYFFTLRWTMGYQRSQSFTE